MHWAVGTGRRIVPQSIFLKECLIHILVIFKKLLSSYGQAHDHTKSYKFLILVRKYIQKIALIMIQIMVI